MGAVSYKDGNHLDYTPVSNVSGGDVIVVDELVGVANADIEANKLGAIAISGTYKFTKQDADVVVVGQTAYYDVADDRITSDADGGTNKKAGIFLENKGATTNEEIIVKLEQ